MWPLKLFHDFGYTLDRDVEDDRTRVDMAELERVLCGPGFRLTVRGFACRKERGLVLCFALEGTESLGVRLRLRADVRPLWPAGLGGQIAAHAPAGGATAGALILTEELGRFAAVLGSPGADMTWDGDDHALPRSAVTTAINLEPGETRVFIVAGAEREPEPLTEQARLGLGQSAVGLARARDVVAAASVLWSRLAEAWEHELAVVRADWAAWLERTAELTTEPIADAAFRWSQVALRRAWIEVDGLGRGLVAGIGESAGGERPGYAWFFDGDALTAARALVATGDRADAFEALRFAASHQRADGKLMHELTLSARMCGWVEEYPYAYYKGLNSADFVCSFVHAVRVSGDLDFARELWPTVRRALAWCATCADDGLLQNTRAGIAAVEAGPLSDRIQGEVFLQGAYADALRSASGLAVVLGEGDDARRFQAAHARALEAFEAFWSDDCGRYGFARLTDGGRCDDLTAYLGYPLARGVGEPVRALASARALNRPNLTADWGARMFAVDSEVYDPAHYNTGSVFPYLTNFVTLACFRHGLPLAGLQLLRGQLALVGREGPGFLEEHWVGDRFRLPQRGVPHQIFSSSAIVESTLFGLLGLDVDAPAGRFALRPFHPPDTPSLDVRDVEIGGRRYRFTSTRTLREEGETVRIDVECSEDSGLALRCEPLLAPGTRVVAMRVLAPGATTDRPSLPREVDPNRQRLASGAVRAVFPEVEAGFRAVTFELDLWPGPTLAFAPEAPERDAASRSVRIEELGEDDGNTIAWRLWGPSGSSTRLPVQAAGFTCQGAHLIAAGLEIAFPVGAPSDTFTSVHVRFRRAR